MCERKTRESTDKRGEAQTWGACQEEHRRKGHEPTVCTRGRERKGGTEGKAHAQERSNSCMKNAGRSTASQKDFTTEDTSQWVAKHMQLR